MDLVDDWLSKYTVWGEGLSCKLDGLVPHFIITCDDKPPILAVESMTNGKGLRETITFGYETRGVNIVT